MYIFKFSVNCFLVINLCFEWFVYFLFGIDGLNEIVLLNSFVLVLLLIDIKFVFLLFVKCLKILSKVWVWGVLFNSIGVLIIIFVFFNVILLEVC